MKPITGIDLKVLAEESSAELVEDEKVQIRAGIKDLLRRKRDLNEGMEKAEKNVAKFKKKLAKTQGRVDRVVGGDWDALKEDKKEDKQE